jgi:hypothetical protein
MKQLYEIELTETDVSLQLEEITVAAPLAPLEEVVEPRVELAWELHLPIPARPRKHRRSRTMRSARYPEPGKLWMGTSREPARIHRAQQIHSLGHTDFEWTRLIQWLFGMFS